jgi:phosphatidylinositol alpha-1,6-mannosyltransferase
VSDGRVLVVTNDFPPRRGGIETMVASLCRGLPADRVVVHSARMRGSTEVDEACGFPVVRDPSRVLLPTPRVAERVRETARRYDCDRVVFGASAPLGLLADGLRDAGRRDEIADLHRVVALTHAHEAWWARVPGARGRLRRIGEDVDTLTYVSDFGRRQVERALSRQAAGRMVRLSPAVDPRVFRPGLDGSAVRRRLGLGLEAPVVLSAARLVARKGQDALIAAMPTVREKHPNAALLLVGSGPAEPRLRRQANRVAPGAVHFLTDVPWERMPEVYAAADVFALACHTRLGGLQPEGFPTVCLEAAAAGLPVVVGRSGGAPETIVDGETGYVVDGRDERELATRVQTLLADGDLRRRMGERGQEWVEDHWSTHHAVRTLADLLDLT